MTRMIRLTVRLNGTDTNPFERWGLTQNPFPQLAKHELAAGEWALNSLGGRPLEGPDDIRKRLEGFDPKFIEGVVERFEAGKMVIFDIEFPYEG